MKLYLIGGGKGQGQNSSNILFERASELWGITFYDLDEIGIPEGADKKWRQESTEKWLQKLSSEDKDSYLLGQIGLGEILSYPSVRQIDKINFCLLDVSDFERMGGQKA